MRLMLAVLATMILAVSAAGPARAHSWYEAETAHFIIRSQDREENVREFAQQVERFDRGLRFLQGMPEDHVQESPANKPVIYRFGSPADMARMIGDPSSGVAGFFMTGAGDSIAFAPVREDRSNNSRERRGDGEFITRALFHEYVHYFMAQNTPASYPRWYSEGYAEVMSTMRFREDGSFHIGDPPQDRAYQVLRMSDSRLDEMFDADHTLSGRDAIQSYGTGWLLTHYLSFDIEREQKLREYLVALGNGEDSLTAATRIFGDLDDMQAELRRYKRGDYPGYNVRPNITQLPEVSIRPLTDAEAAVIQEEMLLGTAVNSDQLDRAVRGLRNAVTQYPGSSHIQMLLAEAEYNEENYAEAETAAARAVELDAENQHAWLYRGLIALEMAQADPAYYEVARDYIAKARMIDLDDPRPLIAYYDTFYREEGAENVSEHAIIALEQAYSTAGNDHDYRLKLSRQLLMEDRYSEALIVALPAMFFGHSFEEYAEDEDEFTPDRLIAAIEAEEKDRAIVLINSYFEEQDEA